MSKRPLEELEEVEEREPKKQKTDKQSPQETQLRMCGRKQITQRTKRHALLLKNKGKNMKGFLISCNNGSELRAISESMTVLPKLVSTHYPKELEEFFKTQSKEIKEKPTIVDGLIIPKFVVDATKDRESEIEIVVDPELEKLKVKAGDYKISNDTEKDSNSEATTESKDKQEPDTNPSVPVANEKEKTWKIRTFEVYDTGCAGMIFVRLIPESIDVFNFAKHIFEAGSSCWRAVLRLIPVQKVCPCTNEDIMEELKDLIKEKMKEGASFNVFLSKKRNNVGLKDRMELIKDIAGLAKDNPINLKTPDQMIMIEVIKSTACLSIVDNPKSWKKFNLHSYKKQFTQQNKPT